MHTSMRFIFAFFLFCVVLAAVGIPALRAEDPRTESIPTRCGVAALFGNTIDPVTDIAFVQLSGFVMWDYDRIWRHWAPDPLRFKIEASFGTTAASDRRIMAAAGMTALYFIEPLATRSLRPYIEGGIGGIYTDFRVDGQGSRINFNPQVGIGTEFGGDGSPAYFAALRLSHLSNAGLLKNNRGVNSLVLTVGRLF